MGGVREWEGWENGRGGKMGVVGEWTGWENGRGGRIDGVVEWAGWETDNGRERWKGAGSRSGWARRASESACCVDTVNLRTC